MPATQSPQIDWSRDVDATLARAKQEHRPVLLDFTAAPQ
jgi:thiol:disulfide interchange protein